MDKQVSNLADLFASFAIGEESWLHTLQQFAEAVGGARGQIIGIGSDAIGFNWVNHFSETEIQHFHSFDVATPQSNYRMAAGLGDGILRIRGEQDYAEVPRTVDNEVYCDLVRYYDLPFGCQTTLYASDQEMVGLAVLRTKADGKSCSLDRRLFAAVAPYVRSAIRTQMALEDSGRLVVTGAFEAVKAAVFMCSANGRVRRMSQAAEELVRAERLYVVDGVLEAPRRKDTNYLHERIAAHAGPTRLPMESVVINLPVLGELPMVADIFRNVDGLSTISPTVIVIIRLARQWHKSAATILRQLYGLSEAEAVVTLYLASGLSRAMIGDMRGVSLETIRTQIKSAFAKLGVSREVEAAVMLGDFLRV